MVRLDATSQSPRQDVPQPPLEDATPPIQADLDLPDDITFPPTNLYSDEPPLETDFHRRQIDLLIRLLEFWWHDRSDFYISGNLTVYYNEQQLKKRDFRGPDVFVVLGAEKRDRRSWAIWEEGGKYPNVVIELLSSSTATVDRGKKKELYQDVWRVPEYYWFHPETLEFSGFHLVAGTYIAIAPIDSGRLRSEQLGLELGIHDQQLRWFTTDGTLIPLPEEAERERAEQERQRAEQERQAKERLESYLRSQGIDPNQLPE
ncbi:Uma2 family endonuclease [Leptolyngbya sp. FACHB-36]|uniref:Uma2 family endonuclease n=1 Tax=Leptolyngbya sp. FACHB-36 TaxID=2692808 RepID=UPI001680B88D|nr:Uma2 family endonuclease [Leptolyngbya sp. FACHB-36]MBD2021638.1 Uma2 family endonuclease [Leptolyngbya sp. FACHB-36]